MSNELQKIKELSEKYATGNYICVVDNRFGPKGYFIKEDDEFKLNWNYALIHKKHEEVLKAFLEDSTIKIFTDAYSDYAHEYYELADYFPTQNFIEFYNENYNYKI